uniref:Uncharacterized protein n=1 Tax=Romanomermis culicivorax TaxID=13658 RepID=A0A915I9V9_ROMCU
MNIQFEIPDLVTPFQRNVSQSAVVINLIPLQTFQCSVRSAISIPPPISNPPLPSSLVASAPISAPSVASSPALPSPTIPPIGSVSSTKSPSILSTSLGSRTTKRARKSSESKENKGKGKGKGKGKIIDADTHVHI